MRLCISLSEFRLSRKPLWRPSRNWWNHRERNGLFDIVIHAGARVAMRVLIADDHPLYREAAALQIRRLYPDALVREVSSLPELRQTTSSAGGAYDLILLDYHMPGMSLEALVQLVRELTAIPLAVISG